ncbi:MAG TPA: DUF4129 domain-containing protein [Acidimicrobiales bacterium]|nr:DUF4129 domain-containing protein [Acidimicrobiales bacterium]
MPNPPWPFPPQPDQRQDLNSIVRSVLAERRFHQGTSLWQRIGHWISVAVQWLFDRLASPVTVTAHAGGPWAAAAVVLVLAVMVFFVVRAVVRHGRPGRPKRPAGRGSLRVTEEVPPRTWRQWLEEAERLAAQGAYREAMRCRYRGVVAALAEAGTVQEVPGRTAGAYQRLVAEADPAIAPAFSEVTSRFERSWYGEVGVAEDDDRDLEGLARRVLEQAVAR